MKKIEVINLEGKEYTLELNRESFIRIDQFANLHKASEIINKNLYEYVDEINDGINPFENDIDEVSFVEEKERTLKEVISKAYWIWLYPNHKLNYSEVKELLEPLFNDDEKFDKLTDDYAKFLNECVEIREAAVQEEKNLKAQANK